MDIIERLNIVENIEDGIPSNPDSIRFAETRQLLLKYITCRRQLRANIPTVRIELKLRFSVTVSSVVYIEL